MNINHIYKSTVIIASAIISSQPLFAENKPVIHMLFGQTQPPVIQNGKAYYSNKLNTILRAEITLNDGPVSTEDPAAQIEYQWESQSGIKLTPEKCTIKFGPWQQVIASTIGVPAVVGYSFGVKAKIIMSNGKVSFPSDTGILWIK